MSLIGAPDTQAPTVPSGLTVVDSSVANAASSTFRLSLSWNSSTDNNQVVSYRIIRSPGNVALTAFTNSYNDSGLTPDTSYTYTVAAFDGQNYSSASASVGAQVDTSLRQDIVTGWGALANQSIFQLETCTSCHVSPAPSGNMDLTGSAASIYTNLTSGRVNTGAPATSLVLCNPTQTNGCVHTGGTLMSTGDATYQTLLRWITDGAPNN